MQVSTLRPGLLVSLKTHIYGGVRYEKRVLEDAHVDDDGTERARWETERTVIDPIELEAAKKVRGKAASLIRRVCAQSAFGLLCPETATDQLERAIQEAREAADEHNFVARTTRVAIFVMAGRIAPDDVEAVRAINSEVRGFLSDMANGIGRVDAAAVREAANRARSVASMLAPEAQERVKDAIEVARKAAREIVKAGEAAAVSIDEAAIRRITEQRTAFLDLGEDVQMATPTTEGRAVDFDLAAAGGE